MNAHGRPRILVLSFRPPWPLRSGFQLRAYHLARLLSAEYDVDLLTLQERPLDLQGIPELCRVFRRMVAFSLPRPRGYLQAAWTLLTKPKRPLQVGYHASRAARRWITSHRSDYDLIFCLHLRMAQYALEIPLPKAIDLIDAASLFYREAARFSQGLWHRIYAWESERLPPYEAEVLQAFDLAFVSSPFDAAHLRRALPKDLEHKLVVLPNGVREELLRSPPYAPDAGKPPFRLVFFGKIDYAPNVDAAITFAHRVLPKLREHEPRLEFWIVGTSPRTEVLALQRIPGVRVTGDLEDPYEILARAHLVVAPLRFGAGISNKVLEAMALGRPVLATPVAVRGIAGRDGVHFRLVSEEKDWPREVLRLLREEDLRRTLGENARRLVQERYRWEAVGERLRSALLPLGAPLHPRTKTAALVEEES